MNQKSPTVKVCRRCGNSTFMREVIYGLPEFPFDESKYVLGGCMPGGPKWQCIICKPIELEFED